ncbi:MAG TPA: hypothetical protein VFK02_13775, partial [Kofleriaceae bacterium]|nr:hypothetical protein [Kofleriaceae bacterium]
AAPGEGDDRDAGHDARRALAQDSARGAVDVPLGRADTARPPTDEDLDPAATREVIATPARSRRGTRWAVALMIAGGAFVGGVLAIQLRTPPGPATAPLPGPRVPQRATGSATATSPPEATEATTEATTGATTEPTTEATTTAPPARGVPTGPTAPGPAAVEPPHTETAAPTETPAGSRSPGDGPPTRPPDESAGNTHGTPHHLPARPPDKRPPTRRPAVKRPPAGDPKDVLIVDPFSHGNSPRSDSP